MNTHFHFELYFIRCLKYWKFIKKIVLKLSNSVQLKFGLLFPHFIYNCEIEHNLLYMQQNMFNFTIK